VARLDGYVVFVAGAIPGDRVRARVHKSKRAYAEARALEILAPSADRVEPVAHHPGAPWQVLPYERQLEVKQEQVADALRRIGRLEGFELETIVPAEQLWRYRNKLEYSFGQEPSGRLTCGFPRAGSLGRDRRGLRLPARLRARERGPRPDRRLESRAGPAGVRPPYRPGPASQPRRARGAGGRASSRRAS